MKEIETTKKDAIPRKLEERSGIAEMTGRDPDEINTTRTRRRAQDEEGDTIKRRRNNRTIREDEGMLKSQEGDL